MLKKNLLIIINLFWNKFSELSRFGRKNQELLLGFFLFLTVLYLNEEKLYFMYSFHVAFGKSSSLFCSEYMSLSQLPAKLSRFFSSPENNLSQGSNTTNMNLYINTNVGKLLYKFWYYNSLMILITRLFNINLSNTFKNRRQLSEYQENTLVNILQ